MKKLIEIVNKFEEWVLVILMAALSIIVFVQVVSRIAGHSLTWSEELARYITIWATFIGASYGFRYGAHIGVEAFKSWLPYRAQHIVDLIADIAVLVLSALMVVFSANIIINTHIKYGQVSPAMRMPIWYAYLAIPVGYFMMTLRNIGLAWEDIKAIKRGKPTDEEAAISDIDRALMEAKGEI